MRRIAFIVAILIASCAMPASAVVYLRKNSATSYEFIHQPLSAPAGFYVHWRFTRYDANCWALDAAFTGMHYTTSAPGSIVLAGDSNWTENADGNWTTSTYRTSSMPGGWREIIIPSGVKHLALIVKTDTNCGIMDVTIDGGTALVNGRSLIWKGGTQFDSYCATLQTNNIELAHDLPAGSHTLRLTIDATKHASSSNTMLYLGSLYLCSGSTVPGGTGEIITDGGDQQGPSSTSPNWILGMYGIPDSVAYSPYPDPWVADTVYALNTYCGSGTKNSHVYKCTTAGTSSAASPTWPTTDGNTVADGNMVWTCAALQDSGSSAHGDEAIVGGITVTVDGVDKTGISNGAVVSGATAVFATTNVQNNYGLNYATTTKTFTVNKQTFTMAATTTWNRAMPGGFEWAYSAMMSSAYTAAAAPWGWNYTYWQSATGDWGPGTSTFAILTNVAGPSATVPCRWYGGGGRGTDHLYMSQRVTSVSPANSGLSKGTGPNVYWVWSGALTPALNDVWNCTRVITISYGGWKIKPGGGLMTMGCGG